VGGRGWWDGGAEGWRGGGRLMLGRFGKGKGMRGGGGGLTPR